MSGGISLVIPVFNGALYIREALESVLKQTLLPEEIIVVDDASTDETPGILKTFGSSIRVLTLSKSGADAARNEGVRSARFDLIAFTDADDCAVSERFALQAECFQRDDALDFVFGHLQEFHGKPNLAAEAFELSTRKPGLCVGTLMARKASFLKAGYFETRWTTAGFMDWYFRVLDGGFRCKVLEEVVLLRRIHGGNLTVRESSLMSREYALVISERMKRRKGKFPDP